MSIARCAATSRASPARSALSTARSSFAQAASVSSVSNMPTICLICPAKDPYGVTSPYGSDRPQTTRPSRCCCTAFVNSELSRLLPIPAGPKSVTSCGRRSATTRSQVRSSVCSSEARPSIGAAADAPAPRSARRPCARHTGTGCCLPLARTGSTSSYAIVLRVAWYVSWPTRIPFTGAADCRRAAVLTTSPDTMPSPCAGFADTETRASPVLTAMRTSRSIPSRIASAARTARSGSSPWAMGAPKTAITASPMNFSTVPPKDSITERTREK